MTPLVGRYEGGAVGPVLVCIGGGVNRKNHVNGAGGLDERVKGDVLEVFATVDEGERVAIGVCVCPRVVARKRVGFV